MQEATERRRRDQTVQSVRARMDSELPRRRDQPSKEAASGATSAADRGEHAWTALTPATSEPVGTDGLSAAAAAAAAKVKRRASTDYVGSFDGELASAAAGASLNLESLRTTVADVQLDAYHRQYPENSVRPPGQGD